jgi:hypothetical protein
MQPLNYCRQMAMQFNGLLQRSSLPSGFRASVSHALDLAAVAEKFMLPVDGDFFVDDDMRALVPSNSLTLPFKCMAIECPITPTKLDGIETADRQILFAVQDDDVVRLYFSFRRFKDGLWIPIAERPAPFRIPRVGWREWLNTSLGETTFKTPYTRPLFRLLNALACSNVTLDRIKAKAGKIKSALPFDDYHVLMVDTSIAGGRGTPNGHRSPREHLRRGHSRRLESGRHVWINACVVAAGAPGKVTKDYAMRPTSPAASPST